MKVQKHMEIALLGAPTCRAKVRRARAQGEGGREGEAVGSDAPARRRDPPTTANGSFADMTANRIHVALVGVS